VSSVSAALVLTNLLYVIGAVVVATVVSALYVLRHRKPKSMEAAIESFSRELRALAPNGQPNLVEAEDQPAPDPAVVRPVRDHQARRAGPGDAPTREGQPG
jgi:hypothetical protein